MLANPLSIRLFLSLTLLVISLPSYGQVFLKVDPAPPLINVELGAVSLTDVTGDGFPDAFVTGRADGFTPTTQLLANDGQGNFKEKTNTGLAGVSRSSISFADVDGNGTLDILLTGLDDNVDRIAKLYLNDGQGNFTEKTGTPFQGVSRGSTAFADVNDDGTQDVLITGRTTSGSGNPISRLYTNDGQGNFTEVAGTAFPGVQSSSIKFADVNGDDAPDVLITGKDTDDNPIAKLFLNDGQGNFTEKTGTPFTGVETGSVAFADVDKNGTQDVLITGLNSAVGIQRVAKLFLNDGQGNFTEQTGSPFTGVEFSAVGFADVNGDSAVDVLITGFGSGRSAKLYLNDGQGNFSEVAGTSFEEVTSSTLAFGDINGDSTQDVLIAGDNNSFDPSTKLYTNDGQGNFTQKTGTPFVGVEFGAVAAADVNGDSAADVLITGSQAGFSPVSQLYLNDGQGNFVEQPGSSIDAVSSSAAAFADVNGDSAQDLLITGLNSSGNPVAKLFTNDGQGGFTEKTGTPFPGVSDGSVDFADVDGDSAADVLITGLDLNFVPIAKLFMNDGQGNFFEKVGLPFVGASSSSAAFADVNGDGAPDVIIAGRDTGGLPIAILYLNDGDGNFTIQLGSNIIGAEFGSVAFGDVNGDNAEDLILAGIDTFNIPSNRLYLNDGQGIFTADSTNEFRVAEGGSTAVSDVNGDGSPDIVVTGTDSDGLGFTELYINDGQGNFTPESINFGGGGFSSSTLIDANGDGKPDLVIVGIDTFGIPTSSLFLNQSGTTTSLAEEVITEKASLVLFPNPNPGNTLYVQLPVGTKGAINLRMYDLQGRLSLQENRTLVQDQSQVEFDISRLPKGYYLVQMVDREGLVSQKLIVH